jgi:KipI family sensor histidine kinase inhibitor
MSAFRLRDVRDGIALLDLPEASDEEANRAFVALAQRLRGRAGVHDAIPGARSLLIQFDPRRVSTAALRELTAHPPGAAIRAGAGVQEETRTLVVPVAYDGPDLEELARTAGISTADFASRHAGGDYRVAFLGFAPGFAYLTGLARELHASRLRVPRTRVPAGSVAIGGPYTGVYPEASPGGWRLIGRTTLRPLDPAAEPPALLRAGDRVRFESVRAQDLPRQAPLRVDATEPRGVPILRVVSPGVAATVQGGPHGGLGSFGIPPGGAADPLSLGRANALAGNESDAPGLEMGLLGCEVEILADAVVALGGDVEAERNGRTVASPSEAPLAVGSGDRLKIGRVRQGVWAYLAVGGGLEPRSRYAPQPRLSAGDILAQRESSESAAPSARRVFEEVRFPREMRLRVLPGPEAGAFDASELARFLDGAWRVSADGDRRGLRLEGAPPLAHRAAPEIPPSGTVPGTIQVPGGGLPIVLGPDGPVTGGYPRIATVIGADLRLLGRAAPGVVLRFAAVGIEAALRARLESDPGVS